MAESIFDDKTKVPTPTELTVALGAAAPLLVALEQYLLEQWGGTTREWQFYGKRAGWTFALVHKGRRVLHVIPRSGLFTAVFTLGPRAEIAAQESDLSAEVLATLASARVYAEGKSVRLDVASAAALASVKQLIAIKLAH